MACRITSALARGHIRMIHYSLLLKRWTPGQAAAAAENRISARTGFCGFSIYSCRAEKQARIFVECRNVTLVILSSDVCVVSGLAFAQFQSI